MKHHQHNHKPSLLKGANRFLMSSFLVVGLSTAVQATPLALTGNYLQVGISDYGTFGSNGNTPPGLLHDPSGTGNFAPGGIPNDYLTPGTPHDSFAINSTASGFIQNDNQGISDFGMSSPTLLMGAAALGYANAATWTGSNSFASITNSYFFNPNDERILVQTVITANQDLVGLAFGRSEDPDPDLNRSGTFDTNNQRGNSLYAPEEFVGSAGVISGLFLGLLNASGNTYTHNTGISYFCCSADDPNNVLLGYGPIAPSFNTGDYGLQIAWSIGDLAAGNSATIRYYYVFGDNIDTGGIPEPASLLLFGTGLAGLGFLRRRKTA